MVLGEGQSVIHVEHLLVPIDRLFRIFAAIGDVVDLLDLELWRRHEGSSRKFVAFAMNALKTPAKI